MLSHCHWFYLPCCLLPSCARIRVQCSDMFIITKGCRDTVTDGIVAEAASTDEVVALPDGGKVLLLDPLEPAMAGVCGGVSIVSDGKASESTSMLSAIGGDGEFMLRRKIAKEGAGKVCMFVFRFYGKL